MGTTLIALYLTAKKAYWVSVGDSPLWLIREGENIGRINQNHSISGLLKLQYEHGEITKEDMQNATNKHMLTSAITGKDLNIIDLNEQEIKDGDFFILASDGIETLKEERIESIIKNSKDCNNAVQEILNSITKENTSNQDNATIVITKLSISTEDNVTTTTPINTSNNNTKSKEKKNRITESKYSSSNLIILSILLTIAVAVIVALYLQR